MQDIETIGAGLRRMRKGRGLPLRTVAAAAEMDSTLLSKVKLGQRLPTEPQTRALAKFFGVPFEEFEAKRLAERFWSDNGVSPAARKAVHLLREQAGDYAGGKRRFK